MKLALASTAASVALGGLFVTGCGIGEVDGNSYDPHVSETVDEPPSQDEIDQMAEQSARQAEESIRRHWNIRRHRHAGTGTTTCEDVTSYDWNWDNDMLCTRADGSQFYTSYEGAARYQ